MSAYTIANVLACRSSNEAERTSVKGLAGKIITLHTLLLMLASLPRLQVLTAKETIAKKKAAMPADIAKGIARISSGLYIVTAQQEGARSAMVASWVTQVRGRRIVFLVAFRFSLLPMSSSTVVR